jgi:hypothetical protein
MVARAVFRGIQRRKPVVNAVLWQTAGVVALEILGSLVDGVLANMPATPADAKPAAKASTHPIPQPAPSPQPAPERSAGDSFHTALEPVARRMERVKLSPSFVREALDTPGELELNELAMRWAGMPNKNERAALREVLDTLTDAGYLQSTGDETWKVLRTAG